MIGISVKGVLISILWLCSHFIFLFKWMVFPFLLFLFNDYNITYTILIFEINHKMKLKIHVYSVFGNLIWLFSLVDDTTQGTKSKSYIQCMLLHFSHISLLYNVFYLRVARYGARSIFKESLNTVLLWSSI